MEAAIASVVLGVVGNGLWAFLAQLGKDTASLARNENQTVPRALSRAEDELLKADWAPTDQDLLVRFVTSLEAEGLVRQLFALELDEADPAEIEDAFVQMGTLATDGELSAGDLALAFRTLTQACSTALEVLIEDASVSAHDARSSLRFQLLRAELRALRRMLGRAGEADPEAINRFEEHYRQHVEVQTRHIVPPYLDAVRRVPINDLFVSPQLRAEAREEQERPVDETDAFLARLNRAVVLGNPGGGKSTLAQKLAYDMSTRYEERLLAGRSLTPALILLRDFGAMHKENPISLRDYLEHHASALYQLQAPPGAFEYLLAQGRLALILDGLDELIDTTYRKAITAAVEHFAQAYPGVPLLVTSREVGYEQAPLDETSFSVYRLNDFSDDQAAAYVDRWFSADQSLANPERAALVAAFNRESMSVPDLRANPLMLGLLCNIYRGENWIPRNRPDVYEKCALMLFERWDRQRGIVAFEVFESHLRPAMEHLAHWIFSDQERQGGVAESDLVDIAARYLHEHRYDDEVEAAHAAREFIAFCRGRAWVFTDTGTQAGGERLYQFTHRTFLEYFTAVHLARTHPLPEDLLTRLRPRVAAGEWDMVSQLAFQIKNRTIEGAADGLLLGVLPGSDDGHIEGLHLCGFAVRTLAFLVPKPATTAAVAERSVETVIAVATQRLHGNSAQGQLVDRIRGTAAVLEELPRVSVENSGVVLRAVERAVDTELRNGDPVRSLIAAEVGLDARRGAHAATANSEPWNELRTRLLEEHDEFLAELGQHDPAIAYDLVWYGRREIAWFLEHHGVEKLFLSRPYRAFENVRRISPMEFLLATVVHRRRFDCGLDIPGAAAGLGVVGRALAESRPPWDFDDPLTYWPDRDRTDPQGEVVDLDGDGIFAVAVAACMTAEAGRLIEPAALEGSHARDAVLRLLQVRGEPLMFEPLREQLVSLGMSSAQVNLLAAWVGDEVKFGRAVPARFAAPQT